MIQPIDTTRARLQVMRSKLSLGEMSKTGFTRTLVDTTNKKESEGFIEELASLLLLKVQQWLSISMFMND